MRRMENFVQMNNDLKRKIEKVQSVGTKKNK